MKKKKGFTLVEIIFCIVLLIAIAGIFAFNFMDSLNNNRDRIYKRIIENIESAGDAYITTVDLKTEDFEDIRFVMQEEGNFTYITLDELKDAGLLSSKDTINNKTGASLEGVVKFSNDEGRYDFEYIENPGNIVTVVYEKNGADQVSRTAQAFICENTGDLAECVDTASLPIIKRAGGRTFGWSANPSAKTSDYKEGSPLKTLLKNSTFNIKNDRLILYAITSKENMVYYETKEDYLSIPERTTCTVYNNTPSCDIILPDYELDEYYDKLGWNTNIDGSGRNYPANSSMAIDKSMTLYTSKKVKDFDILVNKLSRVSSTNVVSANLNIIFCLDVSGSMSSYSRLSNLKKVTTGLVERLNLRNSTISLISFNSSSAVRLRFDQDESKIIHELNSLRASGGTSFTSAISATNSIMSSVNNGKNSVVIFVSDGQSSILSNYGPLVELKKKATIYAMGLGVAANNVELRTIASSASTYFTYNDSGDDMSFDRFYRTFEDIVQNIVILEGDGLENAIPTAVQAGRLTLNSLVISDKYPVDIFLNGSKVGTYSTPNQYFYKEGSTYYFDVYNFSKDNPSIGLANMKNLRIKYFYKEDN